MWPPRFPGYLQFTVIVDLATGQGWVNRLSNGGEETRYLGLYFIQPEYLTDRLLTFLQCESTEATRARPECDVSVEMDNNEASACVARKKEA